MIEEFCISEELNISKYESLEGMVEDLNGVYVNEKHPIRQLEEEHIGFNFFVDEKIEKLTDMLLRSGIEKEEIIEFNKQDCGPVIDFFEIQNHEVGSNYYMMGVGQR